MNAEAFPTILARAMVGLGTILGIPYLFVLTLSPPQGTLFAIGFFHLATLIFILWGAYSYS